MKVAEEAPAPSQFQSLEGQTANGPSGHRLTNELTTQNSAHTCRMNEPETCKAGGAARRQAVPAPMGAVEPHAALLRQPAVGQLLYKVMRAEYLIDSIAGSYLHFNRVDSYTDFDGADLQDGAQLPADRPGNANVGFQNAPEFTAASYYDQCRARTYACCFALENDAHLWENYGSGGTHGKVAVVLDFAWLRRHINAQIGSDSAKLYWQGVPCRQIFSINYGIVNYVDWDQHQLNTEHLPNPIIYTYLKAARFSAEHEMRVSLSTIGMGKLAFGGQAMDLPTSLQAPCDFRAGLAEGGVRSIEIGPDCDVIWLEAELAKLGIGRAPGPAA